MVTHVQVQNHHLRDHTKVCCSGAFHDREKIAEEPHFEDFVEDTQIVAEAVRAVDRSRVDTTSGVVV